MDGGKGVDTLTGGIGADVFICDEFDEIIDFNLTQGDEKIGLCLVNNNNNSTGTLVPTPLIT